MECKKSAGKGHGRNKFKFYPVHDIPFKKRVLQLLYDRVRVLEQRLRLQIGGVEWRESESAWMQVVPDTSYLTITESSYNPNIRVK